MRRIRLVLMHIADKVGEWILWIAYYLDPDDTDKQPLD